MQTETKTDTELSFDEMFKDVLMNAPETEREARIMRADNELLLSPEVEQFCQEVVLHGRLPLKAYIVAFSTYDEIELRWIKPDHPGFEASRLLRLPEVIGRIKELRDMVVIHGGMIEREEIIANLKSIAFDPDAKHSDRLAASKQIAQMEAMERAPDVQAGGASLTLVLPFVPQQLKTVTLDNEPSGLIEFGNP